MPESVLFLAVIVAVALVFDFTNGAHDSANAIATVVSTKVLSPRTAVLMAAVLNLVGAFLGTEVAQTIGKGIVQAEVVRGCQALSLSALLGAIVWNLFTWYLGLPSSSSHALIGGLIGSALAYRGAAALNLTSIAEKVLLPLVLSPLAGFLAGYLLDAGALLGAAPCPPRPCEQRPSASCRSSRRPSWRPATAPTTRRRRWGSSRSPCSRGTTSPT